jgi:hypothetical protein
MILPQQVLKSLLVVIIVTCVPCCFSFSYSTGSDGINIKSIKNSAFVATNLHMQQQRQRHYEHHNHLPSRSKLTSRNQLTLYSTSKKSTIKLSGNRNNNKKQQQEEDDQMEQQQLSRRQLLELCFATIGLGGSYLGTREVQETDYGLWGILPVGTYKSKPTIIETIVPNTIWTMDQKFGILNVQVPLRMTIIKLKLPTLPSSSSDTQGQQRINRRRLSQRDIPVQFQYKDDDKYCLLIYNPIAPTPQCVSMIKQIEKEQQCHVRHIVVGSVALEHKVYASNMGQKFHYTTIWLTPGQYSFPFNLPEVPYLGFPTGNRTKIIPYTNVDSTNEKQHYTVYDWPGYWDTNEIQSDILGPIISRDGAFGETVLFHRPTNTLIVTDTCVQVTDEVPKIYKTDTKPLLYHARDTITDIVYDTPETRRKGWKRVVLFGLYFMPSAIMIKDLQTAIQERRPDINSDFIGIYPWDWVGNEKASWDALTGTSQNKPLVAPILQVLLLNRNPVEVLDFAERVSKWDIKRIIPSHLKNNLSLTGQEYRNAFSFLEVKGIPNGYPKPLDSDLQLLRDAEVNLIQSGAIVKAPPKITDLHEYNDRNYIISQSIYQCRSNICTPKADPMTGV